MFTKTLDIIGAGIGGLAFGYFASVKMPDTKIRIWESEAAAGGLAASFAVDNFEIERFYHHIFRKDKALRNIIANMGLTDSVIWKPATTASFYFNSPHKLSSPLDLLRFKPLPFFDRLRMGWMMLKVKRTKDWTLLDDMPVEKYICNEAGQKVWQVVWEPLLRGKFGSFANNISAAWLWSKLVDRGGSRNATGNEYLGYLNGGMQQLFTQIIHHLQQKGHEVYFNSQVSTIVTDLQNAVSAIIVNNKTIEAKTVVSTVQLPDFAGMLPKQFDTYKKSLDSIDFLSNVCLILILKKTLTDYYWTNVAIDGAPFVGIIEHTNWQSAKSYNARHIAYISSYVTKGDNRTTMSADLLFEMYLPYIQRMFPKFRRSDVVALHKWTVANAQPVVSVGYRKLIPEIRTPIKNLYLCTMAQIYPHDRQLSNGVEQALKTVNIIQP